ncbi:SIMPL domain-containing protein [Spirulina sp. CS-785/01]|uniref:SIMPL domain-containing protein n=1 Tax=Spirulina sp. CS-785/01 TaxID=3021716 RepID=UPI00232FC79C|nr:SIMPL domain-containing protein [Spirulina sp. CS-785/01]MDB9315507.1 SIMPL domain-containing protein [Spirulina sp. CS-785/01]
MSNPITVKPRLFALTLLVVLTVPAIDWLLPSPIAAQEQLLRTLTVTGEGEEKIPTTLASVRLGVEVEGDDAQTVQEEVAQRSSNVVELLRNRQVEQLQTTGIQLRPNYRYNDGERQLQGYIGTNTVSCRLPTEQAGQVMDAAVEAGATRIDGISFTATDAAIANAQEEALRNATQAAREQAKVVLESLNLSSQEIITISINNATAPRPLPQRMAQPALESQDASETPVVGGEQTVRASVTLQIRY